MKYLKTYEKFIWTVSSNGLVSHPDDLSDGMKSIIEDRLTPINDILDPDGKKYDTYMIYIKPQLSFQNTWSNPSIKIIIRKSGSLVKLRDVIDSVMELISELKEHGYVFRHYNLKHMLNQVCDIDNPKIDLIEKSFSNLLNHGCGDPEELYLSFEKRPDDINELWDPFKGSKPTDFSFSDIESKTEELVDILYDIFDEYNIIDGNADKNQPPEHWRQEPNYTHWRYAVYGFTKENPRDRIVISFSDEDTSGSIDLMGRGYLREGSIYEKVSSIIKKMEDKLEDQLGCSLKFFYNMDVKSARGRMNGRIVINIIHDMKLKNKYPFGF